MPPPLAKSWQETWRIAGVCGLIEREARRHGMPPSFLARLINRESRFDDRAVSPVGAQGIAQFMPGTAAMVGLTDPFDAHEAIPAAARHLAAMKARFGNWGLAAAAYNAGPGGVEAFLRGRRLPAETRSYVRQIAGAPPARFRDAKAVLPERPLAKAASFVVACSALPAYRMARPSPRLAAVPLGLSVGRSVRGMAKAAARPRVVEASARTEGRVDPRDWAERLAAAAAPLAARMRSAARDARAPTSTPVPSVFTNPDARPAPVAIEVASNIDVAVPPVADPAAPAPIEVAAMVVPTERTWRRMIGPPTALDVPLREDATKAERNLQICGLIEREARRVGMPAPFFARLINQESRFDPNARSPVGAQGVAQFMPYTAKERGLKDPYDIVQAIPASADYLADLRGMLGNWGLAAMAYNAGPGRIIDAFGGRAPPPETRHYIRVITSRDWRHFTVIANEIEDTPLVAAMPFMDACLKLPTRRMSPPKPESEPWQPWGVQLAASFIEASAVASFERQTERYKSVIGGRRPMLVRTKRRGMTRPMIAARLGAPTRGAADALCAKIKRVGGACVVLKN